MVDPAPLLMGTVKGIKEGQAETGLNMLILLFRPNPASRLEPEVREDSTLKAGRPVSHAAAAETLTLSGSVGSGPACGLCTLSTASQRQHR